MSKTVARAIREHPAMYHRVRSVCCYGSVDLDLHAARIVLQIADRKKQSQSLAPTRAATGSDTKESK